MSRFIYRGLLYFYCFPVFVFVVVVVVVLCCVLSCVLVCVPKHLVVIARDQMKEMGYERDEYERNGGEITETLLRYDMNKTYYLRG